MTLQAEPGLAADGSQEEFLLANLPITDGTQADTAFFATKTGTPATLEQMVADLRKLGTWSSTSLTFSFPVEQSPDYIGDSLDGTLRPFGTLQAAAAREALQVIGDYINLEFVDAGTDLNADIRMYNSTKSGTAGGSPPGPRKGGDMYVMNYNTIVPDSRDYTYGSYDFYVFVHEYGHMMGLDHTPFTDSPNGYVPAYPQDNHAFSAMSYITAGAAGIDWDRTYPATLMLADIAALQVSYGADMTTRAGATVYGFNSNADRKMFDFDFMLDTVGRTAAFTIWDGGGTDTLDFSGFNAKSLIDLNDGEFSSVGGFDLNVAIAHNAAIENAVGGRGIDIVNGNELANRIEGADGDDIIHGGQGNDRLYGGRVSGTKAPEAISLVALNMPGHSGESVSGSISGASGTQFSFEMLAKFDPAKTGAQWFSNMPGNWYLMSDRGNQGLWFNLNGQWTHMEMPWSAYADGNMHRISLTWDSTDGEARFYLDGVLTKVATVSAGQAVAVNATENISFNPSAEIGDIRFFNDVRTAKEIFDNAFVTLPPGTDSLIANIAVNGTTGAVSDVISGQTFTATATSARTVSAGLRDNDVIHGDDGNDRMFGGAGTDQLFGGSGADTLVGGDGADVLDGGTGRDMASYETSNAGVQINLLNNTATGGEAAGDTFIGIEGIIGSRFADNISGDDAANDLRGGAGDDVLDGNGGNDVLLGGLGADQLRGGGGRDIASYADSLQAVTVNLLANTASGGTAQGDSFDSIEAVTGSRHADNISGDNAANALRGGDGDDVLEGNGGNDALTGGKGADQLRGGSGADTAVYIDSLTGVTVNLSANSASGGTAEGDTFDSIEYVLGSSWADNITGDSAANYLVGDAGDDSLRGMGGNDRLAGGAGSDTFQFGRTDGRDTILDFESATDHIQLLEGGVFADLSIAQDGTGTLVGYGDTSILFRGIASGDVQSSWFLFSEFA